MDEENNSRKGVRITPLKILLNGTVLAVIIAVPAVIVTIITHYVLQTNLIITLFCGIMTLFIAMGLGYKVAKKLATI
ncbi:MAG: hypothetical protein WBP96_07960 [Nitrososphaeraceae archaeon]